MTKRKRARIANVALDSVDQYGRVAQKHETTELKAIPLSVIRPDPEQPRRLLPPELATELRGGRAAPADILARWQRLARRASAPAEMRRELAELAQLAHSIANNGLISPITVRRVTVEDEPPDGVSYFIVTGERRYWAHLILQQEGRDIQEGASRESAAKIKALVSPEGITVRAHQLLENLFRKDMNAVEKARALVSLRYELSGVTHGLPDEKELVPLSAVSDLLGISKVHRIRMMSVLNLPQEGLEIAGDHNLSERTMRPVVAKLKGKPQLQIAALRQIAAWQAEPSTMPAATLVAAAEQLVGQLKDRDGMQPINVRAPRKAKPKIKDARDLSRRVSRLLTDMETVREMETLRAELTDPDHDAVREQIHKLIEQLQRLV